MLFYLIAHHFRLEVSLIEGRRSRERQSQLVAEGSSQTLESKHLQGLAFDFAFQGVGYRVPQVYWEACGAIGEWLGLRWGGRWRSLKDYGHLEAPEASYVVPNRVWAELGLS